MCAHTNQANASEGLMDQREASTREYRKQTNSEAIRIMCQNGEVSETCTNVLVQMCNAIEEIRTKVDRLDKRDALGSLDDHNKIADINRRVAFVEKILHSFIGLVVLGTLSFIGATVVNVLVKD